MAGRNTQQSRISHSETGSTGTFTELEEVVSISGPSGQAATIDTTHLRSTAKEKLAGLADYGQVTLVLNYIGGTEQKALWDMFSVNADPESFCIEAPTSAAATTFDVFDFLASVSQCSLGINTDDKQVLNITLQISGSVIAAYGQAART